MSLPVRSCNFNQFNLGNVQLSHLIGHIYIDAIFDMFQGLVQVARTGRSEKTIASICLQEEKREGKRKGIRGIRESERHIK